MQVEFVDPIFDFCDSMAKLDLDEAEYALLVAINTFSTGMFHVNIFYLNIGIISIFVLRQNSF